MAEKIVVVRRYVRIHLNCHLDFRLIEIYIYVTWQPDYGQVACRIAPITILSGKDKSNAVGNYTRHRAESHM
jgi:hypothetical protein